MIKRRKKDGDEEVEANLIPVLSTLFLLIPALLLAMEIAPFTSVRVEPPNFCGGCSAENTEDPPERARLRVTVREDGFVARYGSSPESERTVDIPMGPGGEHDFDALEARAAELKQLFPEDAQVTLSAESSIEYRTLIQSMDALRGRECSLKGAQVGESESEGCYFWSVIVEATTV